MKKTVVSLAAAAVVLVLLLGVVGCQPPGLLPGGSPPEGTYSSDELLSTLDALEGPSARSLSLSGSSVFTLPGGAALSSQDLSTWLNGIKQTFAASVSTSVSGKTYLVRAVKLSLPDGNSGLMWVPFTWFQRVSFPVISYQHGTQLLRECAPSRFDPNPLDVFASPDPMGALQNYVECIAAALMASAGYVVVMPDYPGFGNSAVTHPYVQSGLGTSVAAVLGAAKAALGWGPVTANGKLFLTGYSEGGYATMAAARALGGYVTATVPCDGPYSLSGVMLDHMVNNLAITVPWFLLYTASGYHAAYPSQVTFETLLYSLPLDETHTVNWVDFMARYHPFDGDHSSAYVSALVPAGTSTRLMLSDLALTDLLVSPSGSVYQLLAANDGWVGWTPRSPVVMVHARADDVVYYENATEAQKAFLAEGLPPEWVPIIDVEPLPFLSTLAGNHMAAYPPAMVAAFGAIQRINRGY